ncbi:hypothetical protein [uncultured Methanoregula sp.]|uniref:hypothetical protein n=1 Tax=uncultured Methanoregula sp. TaxID=1005933 RepID=UPI002AABC57D|nr:hypothetical protein [uncultured Methanoregula sp.]
MKTQTLKIGSFLAVGIIAAVICVGMVTGFSVAKPLISVDPVSDKNTGDQSAPAQSAGVITFNPIGDKKSGDTFTITGTTSLPAGTNLVWQIIPYSGTVPTGIDMNAQIGIMANNQVTKGSAASNRISLDVDMQDMKPGKYVIVAASLKGERMSPATGILAGYTYFTMR